MKKILFITTLSLIGQFCLAAMNNDNEKTPTVGQKRKIFYDFLSIGQQRKKSKIVHNFLNVKNRSKPVNNFLEIEYSLAVEPPNKKDKKIPDFVYLNVKYFLEVEAPHKKFYDFMRVEQDR